MPSLQHFHQNSLEESAKNLASLFPHSEIERSISIVDSTDFTTYQQDPVGFTQDELGETLTTELKQLMESVRDFPVTIAQSCNGPGKTFAAGRIAVWWYKCFPNSQVYTAAAPPEENLKRLLWGEILSVTDKYPDIFQSDSIHTLSIQRGPQEFIVGQSIPVSGSEAIREAKFSGKHAPYLLFIIDEGDAVPDEVYRGIESCMSGGMARLLIMFNPRAEIGAPYRMIRDGQANVIKMSAFSHPNVVSGEDKIPGAVTRETTVRRINEWCRPLIEGEKPSHETFELPAFLDGAIAKSLKGVKYPPLKSGHYKVEQPYFHYMVLGEYPAQAENQLISRVWISNARARWDVYVASHGELPPDGTVPIMGQDVAEFGIDKNVSCFRHGGFVEKLVTWEGIDIIDTGDRAFNEYSIRSASEAYIEAIGVGTSVAPHMRRKECNAFSIKVSEKATFEVEMGKFRILRDQLWWMVREWLRTDTGAMLPPDEHLVEELGCPTYEVTNGKIMVMRKDDMREILKRSPDRAEALMMTFANADSAFEMSALERCAA